MRNCNSRSAAFGRIGMLIAALAGAWLQSSSFAGNPIITDVFTADPAALVVGDTIYLYTGQDEAPPKSDYRMNRWLCFSSKDMKTWAPHGSPLSVKDFAWATRDAWAGQVIEKGGKFYWYVSVEHDATKPGKAIGVAVADRPTGPFKDAIGAALVTADMTKGRHAWEDIDPAVFTDADGTSYLFWGNSNCYFAKLKPNMVELDGAITRVDLPRFTEAPWVHKRGEVYYLSYATEFPEKIAYATAPSIAGPWTYRGLLAEVAGNSNTIHQAIIEFKNQWYFIYHNAALHTGDSYRRSVCVDYLYHTPDGAIRRVTQTTEGTDLPPVDAAHAPGQPVVPQWHRIECFGGRGEFVRHRNYNGEVSAYPFFPYEDSMWKVVPGLADPAGVSFEARFLPGHFLRTRGDETVLEKGDGSAAFRELGTFRKEAGLTDPTWTSFKAADGRYLRSAEGKLIVGQSKSREENEASTFRLVYEGE